MPSGLYLPTQARQRETAGPAGAQPLPAQVTLRPISSPPKPLRARAAQMRPAYGKTRWRASENTRILLIFRDYNPEGEAIMQESVKAPAHLWIVGIVSLLWNAVGAFDYLASQLKIEFYMSQFPPEQLEYFYGFPAWAVAAWAVGVWGSFFGSLALLLRKSWAVWLFGASIFGLAVNTVYTYALSDGMAVMGQTGAIFTAVIWVIVLLLFLYARALVKRRVLH